jgi:hypothetical protein
MLLLAAPFSVARSCRQFISGTAKACANGFFLVLARVETICWLGKLAPESSFFNLLQAAGSL